MAKTTYWKGDSSIDNLLSEVMELWHHQLHNAGVRVGIIYAANFEKPAVTHAGYPAVTAVKIVPLRDRLSKGYDAEMTIDAGWWRSASEDEQKAVLDHTLCFLELKRHKPKKNQKKDDSNDAEGDIMLDDNNRPILKLRKGDWNVGVGFRSVVARHGKKALEFQNIEQVSDMVSDMISSDISTTN